jgi:hypothetical protein
MDYDTGFEIDYPSDSDIHVATTDSDLMNPYSAAPPLSQRMDTD